MRQSNGTSEMTDMTMTNQTGGTKSLAELNAIIAEATAQKAQMYDVELERLVREVEERCELLQVSPTQLVKMFRKGTRGRPRKPVNVT